MRNVFASLASLALVGAIVSPSAQGAVVGTASGGTLAASSPRAAKSDLRESPTGIYIVRLADAPLVSYQGDLAGLAATSPAKIGESKLNSRSGAAVQYRAYLESQREAVINQMGQTLGARPNVVQTYDVAYNGFAVKMSLAQARQTEQLPGVVKVTADEIRELQTDTGPGFIGAMQKADVTLPALFKADINGASEKPAPIATSAKGSAVMNYDAASNTLALQIRLSGITPTMQHIHRVANPDGTGPVAYPITFQVADAPNPVYVGAVTISDADEANLYAGKLYLNFHTTANPSGEIRGDIRADKGEGMLVGIIDSGINFRHASFADVGGDGYDHTNPLGAGTYVGVCDPASAIFQATFTCNDKLIGAYTYATVNTAGSPIGEPSPADEDGHGSHTASTTAGNVLNNAVAGGTNVGTVSGVAPHANIIAYDVCGYVVSGVVNGGCVGAAIIGAIDNAVENGVDVINYSIGGDSRDPWASEDAFAFLVALNAGVLTSVSAGNEGAGAETIGSPSNAPWVMSVAATTHNRAFVSSITAGGVTYSGKSFSPPLSAATPIVYAGNFLDEEDLPNPLCYPFKAGTSFAGKIVICDRGVVGRVEKAENAQAAGAIGFVLTNTSAAQSVNGDIYPIPGVHLDSAAGNALKAALTAAPTLTGTIATGTRDLSASNGDIVAGFSSRGPDATSPFIVKPDVAAPGVDIIAAVADTDAASDEFGPLSGTSMAAPHNAGAIALIRSLHPDWSASEVRSALMLTAITTGVRKEDGTTAATPFDIGAGRIDVGRAALSGLVLDETAVDFLDADPFFGGDPTKLNIASVADAACIITCTFTRTFSNTLDAAATWSVSTSASGMAMTATPSSFTIAPGGTQTVTITADVTNSELNAYTFGYVTLTPPAALAGVPAVTLPVSIQPTPSNLPDGITIEARNTTGTEKLDELLAVAISDLQIATFGLAKGTLSTTTLLTDTNNGSIYDNKADGIYTATVTVPAATLRFVAETVETTAADLDMFVFLDGEGSTPADGTYQLDELVCTSATASALEKCDLLNPAAGTYIVVVENWAGTNPVGDKVVLSTGVVRQGGNSNFAVSGPESVNARTPFGVDLT
ncbi:MAG: S8 family serine peptidase, partial [Roseiflexaceae bacterium]|nr:S8 family serine peptidase [Roseiflexaceae bacterium]